MNYDNTIIVYGHVDGHNRITAVDSSIIIRDPTGWLELDRSDSGSRDSRDAYAHASGNYFSGDLTNPDQTHRYIYDPDCSPAYREATAEELEQERAEIEAERVPVGPTAAEVERLDLIQEIVEMRAQLAQIKINGGV